MRDEEVSEKRWWSRKLSTWWAEGYGEFFRTDSSCERDSEETALSWRTRKAMKYGVATSRVREPSSLVSCMTSWRRSELKDMAASNAARISSVLESSRILDMRNVV